MKKKLAVLISFIIILANITVAYAGTVSNRGYFLSYLVTVFLTRTTTSASASMDIEWSGAIPHNVNLIGTYVAPYNVSHSFYATGTWNAYYSAPRDCYIKATHADAIINNIVVTSVNN